MAVRAYETADEGAVEVDIWATHRDWESLWTWTRRVAQEESLRQLQIAQRCFDVAVDTPRHFRDPHHPSEVVEVKHEKTHSRSPSAFAAANSFSL